MTYEVDEALFQELGRKNPVDVCGRSLSHYDEEYQRYRVSFWGDEYALYPFEFRIERLSNNFPEPHAYFTVFIINYLMQVKETPLIGEWISEKDIPSGTTFFRGPHDIPTGLITSRFQNDSASFCRICELLQGVSADMADAAYVFSITPRIAAAVLYWRGDEDFGPEAKLLYDKSISNSLALDTVFALAVVVCHRIARLQTDFGE